MYKPTNQTQSALKDYPRTPESCHRHELSVVLLPPEEGQLALAHTGGGGGGSAENDGMGGFTEPSPFFVGQKFRQKVGFHTTEPPPPFWGEGFA